jgi:GTP-binding protein LepA
MDIVQERLEREYNLNLLITAPSVEYVVQKTSGDEETIDSPAKLPSPNETAEIREPWMQITIVTPGRYIGMEYLDIAHGDGSEKGQDSRVLLEFNVPLSEILTDFYDELKSRTQGYASMDYHFLEYRAARLVKLDVLVNGLPVDALSMITHTDRAAREGRILCERLRELIPRQMFDVPVQAAVGGRIVARETIRAMRKNVLAKCYGGDITRKRKLLEKQAEGKKRMKRVGSVDIPQEAFMAVLRLEK